jgi:hypothetical protein
MNHPMQMPRNAEPTAFLAAQLEDCDTHWSLGSFGALAEFCRDAGEPVAFAHNGRAISAVTARGGIRIEPRADLRLAASESATRESWSHRVSLCLPVESCAMSRRAQLTELGLDEQALREGDRATTLFDLGLDLLQVDACVRVSDPDVATKLRECTGRPVFESGNPAMAIIVAASPARVFVGRVGRIEVYQPIPPPHGRSPEGPHTHVLPKLLQHKRTHAATEPVPDGFVPCAHLYPAHPAKDALGRALPFNARRHDRFQDMLSRFGDPHAVALKRQVIVAVTQGRDPSAITVPDDRFARANVRVAVRQLRALGGLSPALTPWIAAHDQTHVAEIDDTEAMHG